MKKAIVFTAFAASLVVNIYLAKHQVVLKAPTDYHFNVDSTGYQIYTEDMKPVGTLKWNENRTLDSLIINDNQ